MIAARSAPAPRIEIYDSPPQLEEAAAKMLAATAASAVHDRGICLLVLSGGETPRGVYRHLALPPFRDEIDWGRVHLLFGDERAVPPDDPLSNYGMVRTELLSRVSIPEGNIHRIKGELTPEEAARTYEEEIARLFQGAAERFDLALLGVGEDGHTASLFPGNTPSPAVSPRIAAVPGPKAWRVTMNVDLLNTSREIVFLAAGERKSSIVRRILDLKAPTAELPASLILPREGKVLWMLEREAAAGLEPRERRDV